MEYYLFTRKEDRQQFIIDVDYDTDHPDFLYEDQAIKLIIETRTNKYSNCPKATTLSSFKSNFKEIFGIKWDGEISIAANAEKAGYVLIPVWGYSHGGWIFSAAYSNPYDKWDSGLAGFVWCKKENIPEDTETALIEFVDYFSTWYNGEVYQANVTKLENGEYTGWYPDLYFPYGDSDIEKYFSNALGEGKLEIYNGKVKSHISKEDFYEKINDLLENYYLNDIPAEKIELLRKVVKE